MSSVAPSSTDITTNEDVAVLPDDIPAAVGNRRVSLNLRQSNTEPLLRLNGEAPDTEIMTRIRDDVLAIVRH